MEKYAQKVRQFLGAFGCQSGMLDYEELLEVGKMTFNVPGRNLVEIAIAIQNLGRVERSARVKEAILKHWPEPTILWPAKSPVRKSLERT